MSDRDDRIRESMERLFREGFVTGWAVFYSGRYGGAEQPPPLDVTWNGLTPTFTVRRESINLVTPNLHLPNGFRRG